jgi:hypothetical protein
MDKTVFWEIIEDAKSASSSSHQRPDTLRAALDKLSPDEIKGFQETYIAQVYDAYAWPLWGAAYVMNGGCSDDCFDYFRDWLISEGRAVYEAAVENPESLASLEGTDEFELEEFRYVADDVYKVKTGREMQPNYPEYPGDPSGDAWDEDTVDKLFPKLAAKYW